jgi:phosphohistidine phosphatase
VRVYLLRHGIAETGQGMADPERQLTDEGKTKVRAVTRLAARALPVPDLILSSPFRRARETAVIAAEELGYKEHIAFSSALTPESDTKAAWDDTRLHAHGSSVLLVGHQPLFGALVAFLLGAPDLGVSFESGALIAIDVPDSGSRPRGALLWMVTARLAGA